MAGSTYRSSSNVVYSAKYHLVWCPKYRRRVLVGQVETWLVEIIRGVCAEHRAEVLDIETMPDHVHLLVEVDPSFGVSRLVRLMKGRSSRLSRQEFPHLARLPTLWTNSWFCSTVGGAPIEVVRRYVENQKLAA
ncbi:MAG: IS200/IS605 family transposase [Acidimicrobiales bacterium]